MTRRQKYYAWTIVASFIVVAFLFMLRPVPIALAYSIVAVGALSASLANYFFEHDLIPDRITLPGILMGVAAATALPQLVGQKTWMMGGLVSLATACGAFGILSAVIDILKKLAGPKLIRFEHPIAFRWSHFGENAVLEIGQDMLPWTSVFTRHSDELRMDCDTLSVDGATFQSVEVVFRYDRVIVRGQIYQLADILEISGTSNYISMPREAMGFGIVKAMAAYGAFLGWQGSVFTFLGAFLFGGVLTALVPSLLKKQRLPLMPCLAFASIVWMLYGPELVDLYLQFSKRKG